MLIGVVAHHSRRLPEWIGTADFVGVDQGDADTPPGRVARCADNHLGVLQWLADRADPGEWCIVLEDDAILSDDFRLVTELALVHAPSLLVGLYLGTGYPSSVQRVIRPAIDEARRIDASWIIGDYFLSSVGYAVHASVIADAIDASVSPSGELATRLTRWAQSRGIQVAYTAPSLVDHDDDVGSTVWAAGGFERCAWWFGNRRSWNTRAAHLGEWNTWNG